MHKIESCKQDSPPAAGRFNDMILLCRSALHAKKSLPANSLRASGACKAHITKNLVCEILALTRSHAVTYSTCALCASILTYGNKVSYKLKKDRRFRQVLFRRFPVLGFILRLILPDNFLPFWLCLFHQIYLSQADRSALHCPYRRFACTHFPDCTEYLHFQHHTPQPLKAL